MKSPIAIERSNTILYCRCWQETVTFYRDLLCLPVAFENEWFAEFELTADAFLSIADSSRATIDDVGGQGITLTLKVPDVEAVRSYLTQQGVEATPAKQKWGGIVFYCHDPEGHRLEFWSEEE